MKAPWKMLKMKGQSVELNKTVDAWLDQPVSRGWKIFLWVIAVLVAVSILMMAVKWI